MIAQRMGQRSFHMTNDYASIERERQQNETVGLGSGDRRDSLDFTMDGYVF